IFCSVVVFFFFFFFQAEDGIRDFHVTGVQTCALPIFPLRAESSSSAPRIDLAGEAPARHREARSEGGAAVERHPPLARAASRVEIGRASCRERVESSVAAVAVRKKMETEKTDARRETR